VANPRTESRSGPHHLSAHQKTAKLLRTHRPRRPLLEASACRTEACSGLRDARVGRLDVDQTAALSHSYHFRIQHVGKASFNSSHSVFGNPVACRFSVVRPLSSFRWTTASFSSLVEKSSSVFSRSSPFRYRNPAPVMPVHDKSSVVRSRNPATHLSQLRSELFFRDQRDAVYSGRRSMPK
jgi:hypothetical protein